MKKPITIDNYKNLTFSKIICEYYAGSGDEKNQYDILMPIDEEIYSNLAEEEIHKIEIERSTLYINQLLRKFEETKKIDREDFINYQIKKYGKASKDWMYEVFDFLEDYEDDINKERPGLANDFKDLIDIKLNRLPQRFSSRLRWNTESFTETDFLVLTKALFNLKAVVRIDDKKVTQKEVNITLEKAFNIYVKNKGKKLNSACITETHKRKKAFVLKLYEVWKQYVINKLN